MSGKRRRHTSKWDLKEDPPASPKKMANNSWSGRGDSPIYDNRLQGRRASVDAAHINGPRWSSMEDKNIQNRHDSELLSREHMVGSRSLHKDSADGGRKLDPAPWDGDGSYSTRMSPGLDEWRKRNRSRSPKNKSDWSPRSRSRNWRDSRSRSRSRSPLCGSWKEAGISDKNRSRSGVSSQLCREFAVGRCRRGSDCRFIHQDNQHFEESWESRQRKGANLREYSDRSGRSSEICNNFQRGTCRWGASCRYIHQIASDVGKGYDNDLVGTVENDRRKRGMPHEIIGEVESHRTAMPDQGIPGWTVKSSWDHKEHEEKKLWDDQRVSHKALDGDRKQLLHLETENAAVNLGMCEPRAAETLLGDTDMSPDWNYQPQSANHASDGIGREIYGAPPLIRNESLVASHQPDQNQDASVRIFQSSVMQRPETEVSSLHAHNLREVGVSALLLDNNNDNINKNASLHAEQNILANVMHKQIIGQNNQNSGAMAPSISKVAQDQVGFPTDPRKVVLDPATKPPFEEIKPANHPNFADATTSQVTTGNPPIQEINGEQLRQLSNLVQFLGSGQLPQLYAALNPHQVTDMPLVPSTTVPGADVVSSSSARSQKQYDPISDCIELKNPENSDKPGFPADPVEDLSAKVTSNKSPIPLLAVEPDVSLPHNTGSSGGNHESHHSTQPELDRIGELQENEETEKLTEQSTKEKGKGIQEDQPLENMEGVSKDGENKKGKEPKHVRAFRFSLVEYVKELLKPTWKEGQVDKDIYKTIVKKVVEKVLGAMQATSVPQSQEKIDNYLSFAKPKLTKLVQAYVEKFRKPS